MITIIHNIKFDDAVIDRENSYSQVCEHCAPSFPDHMLSECAGEPTCGVQGCNNIATFYLDFESEDSTEDEDEQEDDERHEERERDLMAYYRER